jgi:hypothetical protein
VRISRQISGCVLCMSNWGKETWMTRRKRSIESVDQQYLKLATIICVKGYCIENHKPRLKREEVVLLILYKSIKKWDTHMNSTCNCFGVQRADLIEIKLLFYRNISIYRKKGCIEKIFKFHTINIWYLWYLLVLMFDLETSFDSRAIKKAFQKLKSIL